MYTCMGVARGRPIGVRRKGLEKLGIGGRSLKCVGSVSEVCQGCSVLEACELNKPVLSLTCTDVGGVKMAQVD